MISVHHLTKRYGRFRAVDDLSFDVQPGEAVALWGSNGAGKTTVIRCLLGLIRSTGTINVAGLDARRAGKQARQLIGYVPQELAFHDDLRVAETLRFFARLRRVSTRRVPAVLDEVGLSEHARKRIRELSGGMKQRMALALALLSDSPLLILDELTANLDTAAQSGFMGLLGEQKRKGRTLLFTSHRFDEVESLADRVVVLQSGRKRLECPPRQLAESLGLRGVLQMFMEPSELDRALQTLAAQGFIASRNGVSVSVEVSPLEKAAPIRALSQASIDVRDFDYLSESEFSRHRMTQNGGSRG